MTPDANAAFTEALRARLEADPRVVGLVALGSMARRDYEPDRYRVLLARHVPSGRRDLSDDLDPLRRFELIYPELGGELGAVLSRDTRAAALGLLETASCELASRIRGFPSRAAEAVARRIEEP